MAKSARIIPITNSAKYGKTRPIQKNSTNTTRIGRDFLYGSSFAVLAELKLLFPPLHNRTEKNTAFISVMYISGLNSGI